ncbi:glutaminase liver isoform, mitochondrial-like [Tigriopus californicus]|uniref:glutaminase liver isoform, mitochondrial-like n=1 Tax=Tigriopus californicus TaxID=6832 RepID=UPI0027DA3795|nr:glutaminase liver isoform, mitochondrial-like [Tigriopus californicus]
MDSSQKSGKFEAMLFALCQDGPKASIRKFVEEISRTGVRPMSDPRLAEVIKRFKSFRNKPNGALENLMLDFEQFRYAIGANLPLIAKIFRNDLVIPEFDSFCNSVTGLYEKLKSNFDGAPAAYIPQLARVPSDKWGISICTVDGQRFSIGDVHDKFTIQSTSKPITYALTLSELGTDVVHKYQGREPSGRMFNEIVLDHNNQPHNPMVNSGAIMSSSILLYLLKPEMNMAQKYDYVFDFFKQMAGGEYLGFNNSIFLSERDSADRNSALGYFMRENMCYPPGEINIPNTLDFYFQLCSLEMTCESESVIAATLANGGVCPTTDKRMLAPDAVRNVLSLMLSCGLYNYSGDFAFKVGLPAKSGVSGTLVLVIPNVMGITFWSPPLDEMGNTVRGVQFCEEFVRLYNFHKVSGELSDGSCSLVDPTKNKYEVASQLIIHLLMAASAGDETALNSAFQQGVDMNLGDYDGRTALHLAAAEGHLRCVKFLLEECKVNSDAKDRWGQTPLTEAILFKHTKVASLIKRHERLLQLQANKNKGGSGKGSNAFTGKDDHHGGGVGEVLWRKLVERNLMKPEKERPIFKFNKSNLEDRAARRDEEELQRDQEALQALKSSLKDQLKQTKVRTTSVGFDTNLDSLKEEMERKKSVGEAMGEAMGLDGSVEEDNAAKLIQNKFRNLKLKKSPNNGEEDSSKKVTSSAGKEGGLTNEKPDLCPPKQGV